MPLSVRVERGGDEMMNANELGAGQLRRKRWR